MIAQTKIDTKTTGGGTDQIQIAMTLLVRDEADIIEDNIRFHHAMGVDQFIIMDNLSMDETPQILKRLSAEIPIRIIRQTDDDYDQGTWVTDMARQAAQLIGNGWIINNDADEFWVPRSGSLKQFLAALPATITRINVSRHNAVAESRSGLPQDAFAHPRLTTAFERHSTNALGTPLPPKCMHRAAPDIRVAQGNHTVEGIGGDACAAGDDLIILHYPYRDLSRYRSKIALGGAAYDRNQTLPEAVGITWREQYRNIENGEIERFWDGIAMSSRDVLIELLNADLFACETVRDFLIGPTSEAPERVTPLFDDLLDATEARYRELAVDVAQHIARIPRDQRPTRPLFHNIEYCLNGPKAQISRLRKLRDRGMSARSLLGDFGMLRDMFSLFPRNDRFRHFLGELMKIELGEDVARLAGDCEGKTVILHVTCEPRLDSARASQESFGDDDEFAHILVVGETRLAREGETPLRFSYADGMLRVPTPDSYEALHRKVFYALMLLDLLAAPRLVVKVDDNLHLRDRQSFLACLNRIEAEGFTYAGRAVGSRMHKEQWHGWHIGKCLDETVESRGYQFPLPDRYAAGGYGYALNRTGLEACSYMYLSMMGFFSMPSVGLEDAFVGHAAYSYGLEVKDVSTPQDVMAFPGLTSVS